MHQFDRLCQLALDGEAADYFRHLEYRANYEVNFSDMTEQELDSIFVMDEHQKGMRKQSVPITLRHRVAKCRVLETMECYFWH